jgi:hypothetical protein
MTDKNLYLIIPASVQYHIYNNNCEVDVRSIEESSTRQKCILAVQQSELENNLTDIPLFAHKLIR